MRIEQNSFPTCNYVTLYQKCNSVRKIYFIIILLHGYRSISTMHENSLMILKLENIENRLNITTLVIHNAYSLLSRILQIHSTDNIIF